MTWRPEDQRGIGGAGEREGRQLLNQKDIESERQSDIERQWRQEAQTGDRNAKSRGGGPKGLGTGPDSTELHG